MTCRSSICFFSLILALGLLHSNASSLSQCIALLGSCLTEHNKHAEHGFEWSSISCTPLPREEFLRRGQEQKKILFPGPVRDCGLSITRGDPNWLFRCTWRDSDAEQKILYGFNVQAQVEVIFFKKISV